MTEITQALVRNLFDYNPVIGDLVRKIDAGARGKAGYVAKSVSGNGYYQVRINGVKQMVHRVIWLWMTGAWPKNEIDHINHNPIDNRWGNFREVTHQENGRNQRMGRNNTSGVNGVSRNGTSWVARISVKGKCINLGSFHSVSAAAAARKEAEVVFGYHPNHGLKVLEEKKKEIELASNAKETTFTPEEIYIDKITGNRLTTRLWVSEEGEDAVYRTVTYIREDLVRQV